MQDQLFQMNAHGDIWQAPQLGDAPMVGDPTPAGPSADALERIAECRALADVPEIGPTFPPSRLPVLAIPSTGGHGRGPVKYWGICHACDLVTAPGTEAQADAIGRQHCASGHQLDGMACAI